MVPALLLGLAFAGCTAPAADTDSYVPDAAGTDPADLQRVLIRGFLDPQGFGRDDDVYVVRFAAVTHDQQVVPFDGEVKIFLEPQQTSDKQWIPRFWFQEVHADGFTDDTELPYWQVTADGTYLDPGEPVHLRAEARLPDGTWIYGERSSYA